MLTTTANDLVHYLVERGLLTAGAVVDGHLTVVPTIRRNNNFSVVCGGGPSYFVKTLLPGAAQAPETLHQEAMFYTAAANDLLAPLADFLPRYHLYDPQRTMLVVEHIGGAETITDAHARLRGPAEWIAELAGRALAIIHRAGAAALPHMQNHPFKRQPPWALSLHQITPSFGQPGVQLQTLLLTYPEYAEALDHLRAGWRVNAVMHGDMKFDNCLLLENGEARVLKIIDWELVDAGEDLWDVAGLLQNYLFWSAVSTQSGHGGWTVAIPFEQIQPAMRTLWNTYCAELGTSDADAAPRLERCVSLAAARLLQSVMEMLVVSPAMSSHVAVLLQTSLNIIRNPAAMAGMIVGTEVEAHV